MLISCTIAKVDDVVTVDNVETAFEGLLSLAEPTVTCRRITDDLILVMTTGTVTNGESAVISVNSRTASEIRQLVLSSVQMALVACRPASECT